MKLDYSLIVRQYLIIRIIERQLQQVAVFFARSVPTSPDRYQLIFSARRLSGGIQRGG